MHISVGFTATDLSTRCTAFELPGDIKRHQTSIECNRVMRGDIFIVKKMDTGSLGLFEMYLLSKLYLSSNVSCNKIRVKTYHAYFPPAEGGRLILSSLKYKYNYLTYAQCAQI